MQAPAGCAYFTPPDLRQSCELHWVGRSIIVSSVLKSILIQSYVQLWYHLTFLPTLTENSSCTKALLGNSCDLNPRVKAYITLVSS
jgi:hypothetical protein